MKVPTLPEPEHITMIDNEDSKTEPVKDNSTAPLPENAVTALVTKVRIFDHDVKKFEDHVKSLREQIEAIVEEAPVYKQVKELSEQLRTLQLELKRNLMNVPGYNDLLEELAEEQEALKDAKANISDFLLGYFAETHERQIELGKGEAREVKLKASLGKEQLYQTNIFGAPTED